MFPLKRWNRSRTSKSAARRGLSLLEVILAIAILGGALTVIGELIRLGTISASRAEHLSKAQLLADSRMAELAAGVLPLDAVSDSPCEEAPEWTYSVEVSDAERLGLLLIVVTVQQDSALTTKPLSLQLSRWMADPEYIAEIEAAAEAEAQ